MSQSSFLTQFADLVLELSSHPAIEITHCHVAAGATRSLIARVGERLGVPLPSPLANLYRESNGVELRWRVVAPTERPPPDPTGTAPWPELECLDDDAAINLRPLEEAFLGSRLEGVCAPSGHVSFAGRVWPAAKLAHALWPIDLYSGWAWTCLFVGAGPPALVSVTDFGAKVCEQPLWSPESYLLHLLSTRAVMSARRPVTVAQQGHRLPETRNPWRSDPADLEQMIQIAKEVQ